jgi:hypothetical protein
MTHDSLLLLGALALMPAFGMVVRIRYVLTRADAELEAYLRGLHPHPSNPG